MTPVFGKSVARLIEAAAGRPPTRRSRILFLRGVLVQAAGSFPAQSAGALS